MRYGIIVKMIHRHPNTTNNALRLPMRNIKIRVIGLGNLNK